MRSLIIALAGTLAACSGPSQPSGKADSTGNAVVASGGAMNDAATPVAEPEPAANAAGPVGAWTQDRYLGRWIGVEGMVLDVAAKPGGGVTLDMQWSLDDKGKFDGSVTAEGLRFMRNGVAETAVPSDGDATGLKYLAGKKDCLTVKPGEGYCRD